MKLIGNKEMFLQLNIASKSARMENRSLPHMLLTGAAGCGKTSTAKYIAKVMSSDFLEIVHESVKTRNDVLILRDQLNREGYEKRVGNKIAQIRPTIVFVDEIHRLSSTGQEHLGIAMENWIIPVEKKQAKVSAFSQFGTSREGRGRWCPRFTLIGATTNDGLLTKPFRDRFKFRFLFHTYTLNESEEIVISHAADLKITIAEDAVIEIAKRGRGVPRILVRLLERCRDTSISIDSDIVSLAITQMTFKLMNVDETGLTSVDIDIMKALHKIQEPVGLENLAILVDESKKTITETIEPYLIQQGLIIRAPRGRTLTERGMEYLISHKHIEDVIDYEDIPLTYERSI
jgi:Holliday junction DNA helicase RuvB